MLSADDQQSHTQGFEQGGVRVINHQHHKYNRYDYHRSMLAFFNQPARQNEHQPNDRYLSEQDNSISHNHSPISTVSMIELYIYILSMSNRPMTS